MLDQSLKNNSYVSLINTNVTRAGSTYDANVTGGLFRFANKENPYAIDGRAIYSRRRGTSFGNNRPNRDQDGYKYRVGMGKISGNFTWNLNHGIESDTYNPNDLGILFGNNNITESLDLSYSKYKPFWKVNNFYIFGNVTHSLLYKPTALPGAQLLPRGQYHLHQELQPDRLRPERGPRDARLLRAAHRPAGRATTCGCRQTPAWCGSSIPTTRKKLASSWNAGIQSYGQDDRLARPRRTGYSLGFYPRYRVNNHLTFRYSVDWSLRRTRSAT